jgi:hypothetical protein
VADGANLEGQRPCGLALRSDGSVGFVPFAPTALGREGAANARLF